MNLIELNDILGETLKKVHEAKGGTRELQYELEKAEYEAKIAKQLINSADVILRCDKMVGSNERINSVVGEK